MSIFHWLSRKKRTAVSSTSKEHDYTHLTWGHNIISHGITVDGLTLDVSGFGYAANGDTFLLNRKDKGLSRWRVSNYKQHSDPPDMFHCYLHFVEKLPAEPAFTTAAPEAAPHG